MIKTITINPKNIFKRFLLFNIRAVIAYNITLYILGYTSFKPLIIRGYTSLPTQDLYTPYIAESDHLFLICAPKETVWSTVTSLLGTTTSSGLTLSQMFVCGATFGAVLFGLHVAQEYVLPPVMRNLGWTSWKTPREIALENSTNIADLSGKAEILTTQVNKIGSVGQNQRSILNNAISDAKADVQETVQERIDYLKNEFREEFDLLIATQTTLKNDLTAQGLKIDGITDSMQMMSDLSNQVNRLTVDTTSSIKEELTQIVDKFNVEHAAVQDSLTTTLNELKEQAAAVQNSEHNLPSRMQESIEALEKIINHHNTVGSRLKDTVKPQLEHLGTVVTNAQETKKIVTYSAPERRVYDPTKIMEGVQTARQKRDASDTVQRGFTDSQRTSAVTQHSSNQMSVYEPKPLAEGVHFNISQEASEIIIRLRIPEGKTLHSLADLSTMPPAKSLINSETLVGIRKQAGDLIWSKATSAGVNLALGLGSSFLAGGVPGVYSYMGANTIGKLSAGALNGVSSEMAQFAARQAQKTMFQGFLDMTEKGANVAVKGVKVARMISET